MYKHFVILVAIAIVMHDRVNLKLMEILMPHIVDYHIVTGLVI